MNIPLSQQFHTLLLLRLHGGSPPQDLELLEGMENPLCSLLAVSLAPRKVPGTEVSKLLEGRDGVGQMEEQRLTVVVVWGFQGETSPNNLEPPS